MAHGLAREGRLASRAKAVRREGPLADQTEVVDVPPELLGDPGGDGTGRRVIARLLAIIGALYLCLTLLPVAGLLSGPLQVADALDRADAIVVLAGGSSGGHLTNASIRRTLHGISLFRLGYAPRIILSGGSSGDVRGAPEAALMAFFALGLGVPRQAIVIEHRSHRTAASARAVAEMLPALGAKRVLLVTSRPHMRRALLAFRRAGVVALPANVPGPLSEALPLGRLVLTQSVAHEYVGLVYYWWRGWI